MNATKRLKMKKDNNILSSRDEVTKMRRGIEDKTEESNREFAKSKRKTLKLAHGIYLD